MGCMGNLVCQAEVFDETAGHHFQLQGEESSGGWWKKVREVEGKKIVCGNFARFHCLNLLALQVLVEVTGSCSNKL